MVSCEDSDLTTIYIVLRYEYCISHHIAIQYFINALSKVLNK